LASVFAVFIVKKRNCKQKLLAFQRNSYRTRIIVNGCYWNTCKLVFTVRHTHTASWVVRRIQMSQYHQQQNSRKKKNLHVHKILLHDIAQTQQPVMLHRCDVTDSIGDQVHQRTFLITSHRYLLPIYKYYFRTYTHSLL